jgi:hypothetical protein
VDSIYRQELPFHIKNIMMPDRNNLQNAAIQIELGNKGSVRKIGQVIRAARNYQILEIIPKFGKNQFESVVNLSEVVVAEVELEQRERKERFGIDPEPKVKRVIGEKIRMPMGKKAFEPRERINLIRTCNSRRGIDRYQEFELYLNSELTFGTMQTGVEKYKVIAVDMAKKEIVLLFNGKEKIKVGPKSLVSQKSVPLKKKKKKKKQ